MSFLDKVSLTCGSRSRCEDRVAVFESDERAVIVVADGAGGIGSGDWAAETVIREVEYAYRGVHSANEWVGMLRQLDQRVGMGESTAVVVDIRPYGMAGASLGDSVAWIIRTDGIVDLTSQQQRKPLLGSGSASPVPFQHGPLDGVLLAATDGFANYAKREAVSAMIAQSDFWSLARQGLELVRLPSGALWDDVGIVVARVKPQLRQRTRYVL